MTRSAGLTPVVRRELANHPIPPVPSRELLLAEFSGMLRAGGFLHRTGDGPLDLGVTTANPAAARRAFRIAKLLAGRAPDVATRTAPPRGDLFRVLVTDAGSLADRDLLATPQWVTGNRTQLAAFLRGALLLRGSVNHPSSDVRAELSFTSPALANDVADAMALTWGVHVHADAVRGRVVLTSTAAVGALLVEVGATQAFLQFDTGRLRRELRQQATRLANADAANVARATSAASRQLDAIRRLLGTVTWETLDERQQRTALARLANPDLTLDEVGKLLDPPVTKATVHRRLAMLERLAARHDAPGPAPGS